MSLLLAAMFVCSNVTLLFARLASLSNQETTLMLGMGMLWATLELLATLEKLVGRD